MAGTTKPATEPEAPTLAPERGRAADRQEAPAHVREGEARPPDSGTLVVSQEAHEREAVAHFLARDSPGSEPAALLVEAGTESAGAGFAPEPQTLTGLIDADSALVTEAAGAQEQQTTVLVGEATTSHGAPAGAPPPEQAATILVEGAAAEGEAATVMTVEGPASHAGPAPAAARGLTAELRTGPRGLGLAHKFFLLAAGLVVATTGTSVAVTAYRARVVADRAVREALAGFGGVWRSFKAEREVSLRGTLRTLADEPQTRALLAESVSPETARDWASDKTGAIGADFLAVLDAQGAFLARSDKAVEEVAGRSIAHAGFVKEALSGRDAAAFVREGRRVILVAAAPVRSGQGETARLEGVLFAGYSLERAFARATAAVSGTDVTFLASAGRRDEPPRAEVIASTLGDPAGFLEAFSASAPLEALLGRGEDLRPMDLLLPGDHVIAVAFPLRTGSGDVIGAIVASRSLEAAKAPFTQIQTTLGIVGLVALACAVPVTYYLGQRIARPLVALAASAHAIREGSLDVAVPDGGSDEVGVLARSFARMVSELKEKAELERFVAGIGVSVQDVTQRRAVAPSMLDHGSPRPGAAASGEAKLAPGTVLGGRYLVESLLGQGGMSSVWRARDLELDEGVALKVLRDDFVATDPRLVGQLKEEIKLARRITHPNVLRIHDFGDLDGVRFISMEFVAGPTLRSILDKHGALSLPVGLQLGRQICRGLAAAHEAGVIHRDIKPANVIAAPNGVVKIMDFGVALGQERHDSVGGGKIVGTPDYMCPEQIECRPLDARADVYAVGVVLYEMFTGGRPFRAETTMDTLLRVLRQAPEPIRGFRPDLPEGLEALILRAMAKRPGDRFQSAAELRQALGRISS